MKKIVSVSIALLIGLATLSAFAIDQTVKEDITPPPTEGALTADHIAPLSSSRQQTILQQELPQSNTLDEAPTTPPPAATDSTDVNPLQ